MDDATRTALDSIEDHGVIVIALDHNVGGSEARNIGVRNATGQWVAFLDDDDEWLPLKIEKQVHLTSKAFYPELCLVLTQYFYMREGSDHEIVKGGVPRPGEIVAEFILSSRGGLPVFSIFGFSGNSFQKVPFTAGLNKHQDWDWLIRASMVPGFEILVVKDPLSRYFISRQLRRVSDQSDWEFSVKWAAERLAPLSARAYSAFLVKTCLRAALRRPCSWKAVAGILAEVVFRGCASLGLISKAIMMILLPESAFLRLSDLVLTRTSRFL